MSKTEECKGCCNYGMSSDCVFLNKDCPCKTCLVKITCRIGTPHDARECEELTKLLEYQEC